MASPEQASEPAVTRWTRSTVHLDMWMDPDDDPLLRERIGGRVGQ